MSNLQIKRVVAVPSTIDPSTMYIVRASAAGIAQLYFSDDTGTALRHVIDSTDVQALIDASIPASANAADKLSTARDISATGDATWTVSFDGSANASAVLTLAASGVTAGEYPVVTVDAKGRVTTGRNLLAADIPNLPGSKITSALSVDTTGNAATASSAAKLTTARTINGVNFDGTANITINAVDATDRIASSEKGVANGVATLDGSGLIPSNQLPSYVDDVIEAANLAAFPATGETGKIYVALDTNLIYRWTGTVYIMIPGGVGLADTALKLQNARSISATGDATWTVNFDGSANVTAALTLASTGIVAGEHIVTTFDAKGRALSSRALVAGDIPSLDSTTVTSAQSIALAAAEW